MSLLLLVALFAVAWVVLILPKQRELKRHNALVAAISVGDEVMTGSGIYGTVVGIDPLETVTQVAQKNYQRWKALQEEVFSRLPGPWGREKDKD
jgi:preprotein translocase YajC subunit